MRPLFRPALLACALLLSLSTLVYPQQIASVGELRDQIHKLAAIDVDPSTPSEVKALNRRFLAERRSQLHLLLQNRLDALRAYQQTAQTVLNAEEKRTVAKAIAEIEEELRAEARANAAGSNDGSTDVASIKPCRAAPAQAKDSLASKTAPRSAEMRDSERLAAPSAAASNPLAAPAQEGTDFDTWLNSRVDERVKSFTQARIDLRSNVNQSESPSLGDSSTSLVDQSSASDLIGAAMNLAGLGQNGGNGGKEGDTSASVSATAYSLYSTLRGADPLDPAFYNAHRGWRQVSITLGFEKGQKNTDGSSTEDTTIAGAKWLIIHRRDAALGANNDRLKKVYRYLKEASVGLAQVNRDVKNYILVNPTMRDRLPIVGDVRFFLQTQVQESKSFTAADKQIALRLSQRPESEWFDFEKEDDFANIRQAIDVFLQKKYFVKEGFPALLKALGDEGLKDIDRFIDQKVDIFANLDAETQRAVEEIRRAPQLSLAFTSKLRKQGADEYRGQLIFDYGVHDRINLTLNAGYDYKNSRLIGADTRAARFAGQLQFQMTPEKRLAGRTPLYFYLGSEGNWSSGNDFIYKLQGKVKIPIAEGIDLPLSLTYANRTALINEKDVRGQFGFTFDTARLFRAFLTR
jgi:hypothetical protein